jgi:hypothetical protein
MSEDERNSNSGSDSDKIEDEYGYGYSCNMNVDYVERESIFSQTIMATTTCLHKYAIDRMLLAQKNILVWPPIMYRIFQHFDSGKFKRMYLWDERNIAMLELLLDVPIQLGIKYKETEELIDLNVPGSFDPNNVAFVEAEEILNDLLEDGVISKQECRFK